MIDQDDRVRRTPPGGRQRAGAAAMAILLGVCHGAWAMERQVADGGAPWCQSLASFEPYLQALMAGDRAALATLQGCDWLKAGVVVEVLRDDEPHNVRAHIVQIRVFGHGPSIDGYSLNNLIEDFHRPDGGSASRR